MTTDLSACQVCGRYVFPIDGWTTTIPVYRNMIAPWKNPLELFSGDLHDSCLRSWHHREQFRDAYEHLLRDGTVEYDITANGQARHVEQMGLHFSEQVFTGKTCRIFRSSRRDEWAVLDYDGPCYFISRNLLKAIGNGAQPRKEGGVGPTRLPSVPDDDISTWSLPQVLDFLGVIGRYEDALEHGNLKYDFYSFHAPTRVLEYAVDATLPIDDETLQFLRQYAHTYTPIRR
jgi:hypothetical protein